MVIDRSSIADGIEKAAVKLSEGERQIVRELAAGKTNAEIATALSLQKKTVDLYLTILIRKLGSKPAN